MGFYGKCINSQCPVYDITIPRRVCQHCGRALEACKPPEPPKPDTRKGARKGARKDTRKGARKDTRKGARKGARRDMHTGMHIPDNTAKTTNRDYKNDQDNITDIGYENIDTIECPPPVAHNPIDQYDKAVEYFKKYPYMVRELVKDLRIGAKNCDWFSMEFGPYHYFVSGTSLCNITHTPQYVHKLPVFDTSILSEMCDTCLAGVSPKQLLAGCKHTDTGAT